MIMEWLGEAGGPKRGEPGTDDDFLISLMIYIIKEYFLG